MEQLREDGPWKGSKKGGERRGKPDTTRKQAGENSARELLPALIGPWAPRPDAPARSRDLSLVSPEHVGREEVLLDHIENASKLLFLKNTPQENGNTLVTL